MANEDTLEGTSIADTANTRIPGGGDIWVLIGGDFIVFTLIFTTYTYYWQLDPAVFYKSSTLLVTDIGFANTLLLLTGSWLVATAMRYFRSGQLERAGLFMGLASLTGVVFLANKAVEWTHLFAAGNSVNSNDYFMFFFMLTGIHGLHVVIGTGVLIYFYSRLSNSTAVTPSHQALEGGALFWHLVDILWIVLFALLYLIS